MTKESMSKESMSKESKTKVVTVLGLMTSLFVLTIALEKSDRDHNALALKPKTPSRCMASDQSLCNNQEKIDSLKHDLADLEIQKKKILTTIEKVEEKAEEDKSGSGKATLPAYLQLAVMQANHGLGMSGGNDIWAQYSEMGRQMGRFDPISSSTSEQRYDYLNRVMVNRWSVMMDENTSWSPNFNSQGDLTNPLYGNSGTWNQLRTMYRNPSSGVIPAY